MRIEKTGYVLERAEVDLKKLEMRCVCHMIILALLILSWLFLSLTHSYGPIYLPFMF